MAGSDLLTSISLIYAGAAIIATLALFSRQSLVIAYIVLGMLLGPYGFMVVNDDNLIQDIGHVGMIFLLFLAGLHLDPKNLASMLQKAVVVTLSTSLAFAGIGYAVAWGAGFSMIDSVLIGAAMMFSSTLLGLKLLPNSLLHSHHLGEVIISVLLIQDLLAILTLIILQTSGHESLTTTHLVKVFMSVPLLCLYAFFIERFFLAKLFKMYESVREYLFITSVGWCLLVAQIATWIGLSHDIGAFIAGVAIATGSISSYLSECFSPLRDFFLVLFFFAIGANLNIWELPNIYLPVIILTVSIMVAKPTLYWWSLLRSPEEEKIGWEVGVRLGQASEFSVLVAQVASQSRLISPQAAAVIQATTILSFMISSYWVTQSFKTPAMINKTVDD